MNMSTDITKRIRRLLAGVLCAALVHGQFPAVTAIAAEEDLSESLQIEEETASEGVQEIGDEAVDKAYEDPYMADIPDDADNDAENSDLDISDEESDEEFLEDEIEEDSEFSSLTSDEDMDTDLSTDGTPSGQLFGEGTPAVPVNAGQYFVKVHTGKGVQPDVKPGLSVWFDTWQEAVSFSETMEKAADLPKNGEVLPGKIAFSVSSDDLKYFANCNLRITKDGKQNSIDLFDVIREDENHTYVYEPEGGLDADSKYEVDVTFSYTRSVGWTYAEEKRGSDDFVDHCRLYLLDDEGKDREYVDEAYDPSEPQYHTTDYVNYQLIIGENYKFRLVPDYGYEIVGLSINGYVLEPADATGVFDFTMQDFNFHFNGIVREAGNTSLVASTHAGSIEINDTAEDQGVLQNAVEDGTPDMCGGTLLFCVSDAEDPDLSGLEGGKYADPSKYAATSLDISIDNIVSKGTGDGAYWDDHNIAEFADNGEVAVTLGYDLGYDTEGELPEGAGSEFTLVREHEGVTEVIDNAVFDPKNNTVSFETGRFSTYTILRNKEESQAIADKVIFDTNLGEHVKKDCEGNIVEIKPAAAGSGLGKKSAAPEDAGLYNYTGTGDIRLQIRNREDREGSEFKIPDIVNRLGGIDGYAGWNLQYSLIVFPTDEDYLGTGKDPYIFGIDEDGIAVISSNAEYDNNRNYIQEILEQCYDYYSGKGETPTVHMSVDWVPLRPARQVILNNTDAVDYTLDEVGNEDHVFVIDGNKRTPAEPYIYVPHEGKIRFKAEPKDKNYIISSITYRVIDTQNQDGELVVSYPRNHSVSTPVKEEDGWLCAEVLLGDDYWNNYGIEISATVTEASQNPDIKGVKPVVTQDKNLTTNQGIGLSFSLPKNFKVTPDMYYRIEAKARYNPDDVRYTESGQMYYPELSYTYRDEQDVERLVNVFAKDVTAWAPATGKTYCLNVADSPAAKEDGWFLEYDIKVTLVLGAYNEKGASDQCTELTATTRESTYETSLKLGKGNVSKFYTGMQNVELAVAKYSATTSVKALEYIEVYDKNNFMIDHWDRWSRDERYVFADNDTGIIYLNTCHTGRDEQTGDIWREDLAPGNYSIAAYAVSGPGIQSKATFKFTIYGGINYIELNAPTYIYKTEGKASSFTVTSALYSDWGTVATKKVQYSIKKPVFEGDKVVGYSDLDATSPLNGKVSVKTSGLKGNVSIAKDLVIGDKPEDYTFVVMCEAADYSGNGCLTYTEPINIWKEKQVVSEIRFRWFDPDVDEKPYYSPITEENIKNGQKFYSNDILGSDVVVFDQNGKEMSATLKVSGGGAKLTGSRITAIGSGKVTVTATAMDGSKSKKALQFQINYADGAYKLNVLMQDSTGVEYDENDYYKSFINRPKDDPKYKDPVLIEGQEGAFDNTVVSTSPVYLYVAGVRAYDEEGHEREVDFYDNCQVQHSISIKNGKKTMTEPNFMGNYTRYTILPTGRETVVSVKYTINKVTSVAKYTFVNKQVSENNVSAKIKANKSKIFNMLNINASDIEAAGKTLKDVDNCVEYTINNAPAVAEGEQLAVKVSFDTFGEGYWELAEGIGITDEVKRAYGVVYPVNNSKFNLTYFSTYHNDEYNETWYHLNGIKAGTYNIYMTVGVTKAGVFTPKCKTERISVKVAAPPKTSVTFKTAKYTMSKDEHFANLERPVVKNAYGIRNWYSYDREDKQYGDAFTVRAANTKGIVNCFERLFWTETTYSGSDLFKDADSATIRTFVRDRRFDDEFYIDIKDSGTARIDSWYALKMLKEGTFRADDHGFYDESRELLGTVKNQKAAYTKFAKENFTGYIYCRGLSYDGTETEFTKKITVNVDALINNSVLPKAEEDHHQ